MTKDELAERLKLAAKKKILVLGDFFLDRYLLIDPSRNEPSIETGLTAYQVFDRRLSPGAAGTVTNNLVALGVSIVAIGFVGDDGEGFELRRALERLGVDTRGIVVRPDRATPTYTKPMIVESDGERELNRLDIKNWTRTPQALEREIIRNLEQLSEEVDAIVVMDQVNELDCGTVTGTVRESLARLGASRPNLPIIADSRARIGEFKNVMVKPNHREALLALNMKENVSGEGIRTAAMRLCERNGRPAFVTHGAQGMYVADKAMASLVPAITVEGPIDIVGAGDSATAGIVTALSTGSSLTDAALIGNIVASITIQQLGTTGTASQDRDSHGSRNKWGKSINFEVSPPPIAIAVR